jgi:hypothetical protein
MHTLADLLTRGEDSLSTKPQTHSYVCFLAVAGTNPQISIVSFLNGDRALTVLENDNTRRSQSK